MAGEPASTAKQLGNQSLAWLLLFVLINGLVLNPFLSLLDSIFIAHHDLPSLSTARRVINSHLSDLNPLTFLGDFDNDSLGTMLPALTSLRTNPQLSPYDVVFFQDNLKFQYPLTSLLPLYLLQRIGMVDDDLSDDLQCRVLRGFCGNYLLFNIDCTETEPQLPARFV